MQITELTRKRQAREELITTLNNVDNRMVRTSSWKMIQPLRKLSKSVRKRSRKIRNALFLFLADHSLALDQVLKQKEPVKLRHLCRGWYEGSVKKRIVLIDSTTPTPDQD